MLSLYYCQLGVLVHIDVLLVGVRRHLSSMQHQCPLKQNALLWFLGVKDDKEFPGATGVLGPGMCGHEGPLCEAISGIIILGSLAQDQGSASQYANLRHQYLQKRRPPI